MVIPVLLIVEAAAVYVARNPETIKKLGQTVGLLNTPKPSAKPKMREFVEISPEKILDIFEKAFGQSKGTNDASSSSTKRHSNPKSVLPDAPKEIVKRRTVMKTKSWTCEIDEEIFVH